MSIGDLVRLFFSGRESDQRTLSTEVIGEVVDVVVKTEVVTIRLPCPMQMRNGRLFATPGCLPYLQALLHTKHSFLDARKVLHSIHEPNIVMEAQSIQEHSRKQVLDTFRFDVRFGFQGGRGFDIIEGVVGELFAPAVLVPVRRGIKSKKTKAKIIQRAVLDAEMDKKRHLHRLVAPTNKLVMGVISQRDRERRRTIGNQRHLEFVLPVNSEQQRAVEDIVFNYHGEAPYIIEGPAGTGEAE